MTTRATKAIDASDWAGDRGDGVLTVMQALLADVRTVFAGWAEGTLARVGERTTLPAVPVLAAAEDLVRWRLTWLDLDNLLRARFYGEAPRTKAEVVEGYLEWVAGHLDLTPEQYLELSNRVAILGWTLAGRSGLATKAEAAKPETLWELVAPDGVLPPDALQQALLTRMSEAATLGGNAVFEALDLGITFNLPDTRAQAFLEEYSLSFSEKTARGSEEKIRKSLLEGLAKGQTTADITREIETVHQSLYQYEAERIARTEIIRAHAQGQVAALAELGAAEWTWITAEDERVCEICGPLNGQVFPVDGEREPPPAHPGCRCSAGAAEAELERIVQELLTLE